MARAGSGQSGSCPQSVVLIPGAGGLGLLPHTRLSGVHLGSVSFTDNLIEVDNDNYIKPSAYRIGGAMTGKPGRSVMRIVVTLPHEAMFSVVASREAAFTTAVIKNPSTATI